MTSSTQQALSESVGKFTRLINETDNEGRPNQVRIHVHGELEAPGDTGEWSVKINDTVGGASRVGFPADKIESVFVQPSGTVEIILRG